MGPREEIRPTVGGDTYIHVHCVEKKAKENHGKELPVGEVWRPRSRNNWPVALKASANLVGNFVSEPPELSRPLRTRALQVPFEV